MAWAPPLGPEPEDSVAKVGPFVEMPTKLGLGAGRALSCCFPTGLNKLGRPSLASPGRRL